MGTQDVASDPNDHRMRNFTKAVLDDLAALERMIELGRFETGIRRIGAEQEMFLVDRSRQPAPIAVDILEAVKDPRLTTELAKYNLEANLTPLVFGTDCLHQMESELKELLERVDDAARRMEAGVALTGILPTLRRSHLTLDYMTPNPRYFELNRAISTLRDNAFDIVIKGLDELDFTHDNVMLEAANTSFQIHFQVGPEEFAMLYNLAQAVSAPVLAAAVNSPLLLGQRLWCETRVALFQRSVDARSATHKMRAKPPRVSFGDRWIDNSILEIYRDDITRFRVMLSTDDLEESPLSMVERGEVPQLRALRMHTGTVWRWNRACYGIGGGRPHLRIENRILPAGPTVIDEFANAAFFFGLMAATSAEYPKIHEVMAFDDAKQNFFAAARHGLNAQSIGSAASSSPPTISSSASSCPRRGRGSRTMGSAARTSIATSGWWRSACARSRPARNGPSSPSRAWARAPPTCACGAWWRPSPRTSARASPCTAGPSRSSTAPSTGSPATARWASS
ncbi:MAG: hypothetical protein R3B72_15570 [Polyangiaceae bacterium]